MRTSVSENSPYLEIIGLCKQFGNTVAVDGINLAVEKGKIICLLGPSGCGKTTLLRLIAGLESPDSGSIRFAGKRLESVPVHQRNFGFMFQDYALFPHKNVAQNIAFGLRMAKIQQKAIDDRVEEVLAMVGLEEMRDRPVGALSGGEKQRVALARSLAPSPHLLLLDEPLGSLDRALRERLMNDLRTILKNVGVTAITVTHDQQEAFALSDHILVMNAGRSLQMGAPEVVYRKPNSEMVARFLGFTNILDGRLVGLDPTRVETSLGLLQIPQIPSSPALESPIKVLIRPEAATTCPGENTLSFSGIVTGRSFRGEHTQIKVRSRADTQLTFAVRTATDQLPLIGNVLELYLDPGGISLLSADDDGSSTPESFRSPVLIQKLDAQGRKVLSYEGVVLARTPVSMTVEALFNGEPVIFDKVSLAPGDKFIEHHYSDRWYNIFEIYDRRDECLKAWYCNVTRPATLDRQNISAEDLAIDLLISTAGDIEILDREEFEKLSLSPDERDSAQQALNELQILAQDGKLPRTIQTGNHDRDRNSRKSNPTS